MLLETDSGGTTQVAYTLEPQVYGNLISQRRSGASAWHHFDGLGSTERLTDSDQAALATYLNTAFGVPKVASGNHPNRLRFGGRIGYRWEPDPSEYDIRGHRLDPSRGSWLSRWPVVRTLRRRAAPGQDVVRVGSYAYEGGNPVNRPRASQVRSRMLAQDHGSGGRCRVGEGSTTCDPVTGTETTTLDPTYHACDKPCVDAHEAQHRHDDAGCCHRMYHCWENAHGDPGLEQDCRDAWGRYILDPYSERYSECRAYFSDIVCFQRMWEAHDCRCHPRTTCCAQIKANMDWSNNRLDYYGCRRHQPTQPPACTFDENGRIVG